MLRLGRGSAVKPIPHVAGAQHLSRCVDVGAWLGEEAVSHASNNGGSPGTCEPTKQTGEGSARLVGVAGADIDSKQEDPLHEDHDASVHSTAFSKTGGSCCCCSICAWPAQLVILRPRTLSPTLPITFTSSLPLYILGASSA